MSCVRGMLTEETCADMRIQRLSSQSLTALWRSKSPQHTVRVMSYYFERVVKYMELLDTAEVVTKNAYVRKRDRTDIKGVCSCIWGGLRFCIDPRISIQGRVLHDPYRQTGELCVGLSVQAAGELETVVKLMSGGATKRTRCYPPHSRAGVQVLQPPNRGP